MWVVRHIRLDGCTDCPFQDLDQTLETVGSEQLAVAKEHQGDEAGISNNAERLIEESSLEGLLEERTELRKKLAKAEQTLAAQTPRWLKALRSSAGNATEK